MLLLLARYNPYLTFLNPEHTTLPQGGIVYVHAVAFPFRRHEVSEDEPPHASYIDGDPKEVIIPARSPVETQVLRQFPGKGKATTLAMHLGGSRP
jgi:hypothetical protein